MGYPWPSFGSFLFEREETAHFGTDVGWVNAPSFVRQRPLGGLADNVTLMAFASADRSFEQTFTQDRFNAFAALMGTVGLFTDWATPYPDSRQAELLEVTALEYQIRYDRRTGLSTRIIRTKVSLLSL